MGLTGPTAFKALGGTANKGISASVNYGTTGMVNGITGGGTNPLYGGVSQYGYDGRTAGGGGAVNLQNPSARNRISGTAPLLQNQTNARRNNPGTAPLPNGNPGYPNDVWNAANNYQNAFGQSLSSHGLDFASLGLDRSWLEQQGAFNASQDALARQNLYSNNQFDTRNLANDQATLGLRRQQNMLGLQSNEIDRGQIAAGRGFAQRDLDLSLADAMRRGIIQTRDNNSQSIARGAWNAPFRGIRNNDILNNTRATGDQARLGFDQTMSGLGAKEARLGLDDQQIKLADQILGQQASQLGIRADQLRAQYDEGLAKLGLQGQIDAQTLAYKMSHGSLAEMRLWQQIAQEATQAAGMNDIAGDIYARMMGG